MNDLRNEEGRSMRIEISANEHRLLEARGKRDNRKAGPQLVYEWRSKVQEIYAPGDREKLTSLIVEAVKRKQKEEGNLENNMSVDLDLNQFVYSGMPLERIRQHLIEINLGRINWSFEGTNLHKCEKISVCLYPE